MNVEQPLIARDLSKVYRRLWRGAPVPALRGVSFAVERGRVLGLVGPNGSGKTTAIRCALGLLTPSGGSARVFGAPAGSLAARRGIGFAPEHFALSGKRSGRETLLLLAALSGCDRRQRLALVDRALETVGLREAGRQHIGGYSKGMLRRLSIAAAIQHDPPLLVLDEPFDGLDPLGCAAIRDEIERRAASGVAVLLSSHALADLEAVATDLLVLDHGVVIEHGSKDAVLCREGLTALCVQDLSDAAWSDLLATLDRHGARVTQRGPSRESLEALFRRRVRGRDAPP